MHFSFVAFSCSAATSGTCCHTAHSSDGCGREHCRQLLPSISANAKCFDVYIQGNWQLAEQLFQQLEVEARAAEPAQASPQTASPSSFNAYAVDWAASQPAQTDTNSGWEHQQPATRMTSSATPAMAPINISVPISTSASVAEVDDRRLSSGSFGDMPTHIAEQVGTMPDKRQPEVVIALGCCWACCVLARMWHTCWLQGDVPLCSLLIAMQQEWIWRTTLSMSQ